MDATEPALADEMERVAFRRVSRRLLPYLFLLLVVNYLDRVNVGFAALRMNKDLGFSAATFGFGAGVFFVGYALFEVPSNLALHRFGARLWIGRILVTWGVVSGLMAFARSEWQFYLLRFLLGVGEAGFLPGVVYYLTDWYPAGRRARAIAGVILAIAIAPAIGGPLSGAVMTYADGAAGLHGWQWMFLVEAVPAVVLGLVTMVWLTDRPADAAWLPEDERRWLDRLMGRERAALAPTADLGVAALFRMGRVWALAAMFACQLIAFYGILLWLPQIIKHLGQRSDLETGLLAAVPFLCGAAAMVVVSRSSDRSGDRKYHMAAVLLAGAAGLLGSGLVASPVASFLMLCLAAAGLIGSLPLVWTMSSGMLAGAASAGAIALVNTLAQVGGLLGPWGVGIVRDRTGSFAVALALLAASALAAAVIALLLQDDERARRAAVALANEARAAEAGASA